MFILGTPPSVTVCDP